MSFSFTASFRQTFKSFERAFEEMDKAFEQATTEADAHVAKADAGSAPLGPNETVTTSTVETRPDGTRIVTTVTRSRTANIKTPSEK